jgi:hypothetical protein
MLQDGQQSSPTRVKSGVRLGGRRVPAEPVQESAIVPGRGMIGQLFNT